jgi:tetratricopeptide (TPR) repeat protein
MLWTGSVTRGQDSAVERKIDRIDRVRQWVDAVEQHQPGLPDDALLRVAAWDRATLWRVWADVGSIVSLIRVPNVSIFYEPVEAEPFSGIFRSLEPRYRTREIRYGSNDVKRLRTIAEDVKGRGGDNRLLKRGASLHADIVMLEASRSSALDPAQRPRAALFMVYMNDGQQTGVDDGGVHWEMGRRLLDRVRPQGSRRNDPGQDETVRLWYLTSNAYMQAFEQLDAWHVERAVQLFPRDPEILFLAACAREMFSGPQIQGLLESTTLSRNLFNLIGDEGDELQKAERLFRQTLERDPTRSEARIRLGHVLGKRGRHQDAIVELRRATVEADSRLLQYYGQLFLGAEAAALDLIEEAQHAYARAIELYPWAQSPHMGVSALAARTGDSAGALSAIDPVLNGDDPVLADDPWWTYYTSQGRDLAGLLESLYVAIEKGQ